MKTYTEAFLKALRDADKDRRGEETHLIGSHKVTVFYGIDWRLRVIPMMGNKPLRADELDDFVKVNRSRIEGKIK